MSLHEKAATKGVNIGNTNERRKYSSSPERWFVDPIYREGLGFEARTRRDCELQDHFVTTQDKTNDPKYQRTMEEGDALRSGWRMANVHKTGRAEHKDDVYSFLSHSFNLGTFTPWRSEEHEDKKGKTYTQEDWKYCHSSSSTYGKWSNWRWHE